MKILKYSRQIYDSITKTALLIVITTVAYILLLYFLKYLWFLFISTPVGQAYAQQFSYSYRISNDLLSTNFINLATRLTVTSFIISLIIGSICQFFLIIRYFYSYCGLVGKTVFFGLPLAYMVAAYMMRYVHDFGDMYTAFTIAVVPTLSVFTGSFRIAEDYIPELVDVKFIFSGQQRKTSSKPKAAYIIVILIIIIAAGLMFTIPQTQNFQKRVESAPAEVHDVKAPVTSRKPNVTHTPHTNFTYNFTYDGYSYDEKANSRLAVISGKMYHEGDLLPGNHVLKRIDPSHIIIRNKVNKSERIVPLY